MRPLGGLPGRPSGLRRSTLRRSTSSTCRTSTTTFNGWARSIPQWPMICVVSMRSWVISWTSLLREESDPSFSASMALPRCLDRCTSTEFSASAGGSPSRKSWDSNFPTSETPRRSLWPTIRWPTSWSTILRSKTKSARWFWKPLVWRRCMVRRTSIFWVWITAAPET